MFFTGIDLHKKFVYLTTVDGNGKIVKQQKIYNDPMKILNYFWSVPGTHKAVVESTIGWYWLTDLLHENGIEVVLANARNVKAFAQTKVKTDKIDSQILAQLLRTDFIPEAYQIPRELRDKRDLMRARLNLMYRKTRVIHSVYGLLEKFNITDPDELTGLYHFQFQQLDQQLELLDNQIKELEKTIYPLLIFNEDVQRILWVPGMGKINAFTIHLEVGDFSRFPSEKHFFSYSRVVPAAYNSGGKCKHNTKESKAGNKYLKIVFNTAAVNAYTHYPVIRDFYNQKCRKKNKHLARNLVAKELSRIIYHISKKRCDYDFTFKGRKLTHKKLRYWPHSSSPRTRLAS